MSDMHMIEAEELMDDFQKEALIKNEKIKESKAFIMTKAKDFDGTPFTIQRLAIYFKIKLMLLDFASC